MRSFEAGYSSVLVLPPEASTKLFTVFVADLRWV